MSDIDNAIIKISPHYERKAKNKKKGADISVPSAEHKLVYDSTSETLEPIYFWILDFMNGVFRGNVTKIIDNFASSPGSGHFSELQGKASQMQQESSRVLGTVNNILKGVLNLIYDLKEFKIRLAQYDDANSKDPAKSEAGILGLKQLWMDKVDIQRGQGSILAMSSGNLNFVTLRDAFFTARSLNDVDKLDLNDRVKRILKPRIQEFFEWRKRSEQELRKRFEIEKNYLKGQVDALKLNAKWAKPYLKAAQQLASNDKLGTNPALVNIFNTVMLELTLMGQNEIDIGDAIIGKDLPSDFKNIKMRKYHPIVFVDFNFRGIPGKAGQHYVFGGKAEVTFKAYALNEEELKLLKDELENSDLADSLKLIQGMTDDSLEKLKFDINEILNDEETSKEKINSEDTNPFTALFSFFKSSKPKIKKDAEADAKAKLKLLKEKGVKPESYTEKYVRNLAEAEAINTCFNVFEIYKKAHGMASFPYKNDATVSAPMTEAEKLFGFGKE